MQWVLLNPTKKTLIACLRVKQVEAIVEALNAKGIDSVETLYGNKSTYSACQVLVATINKVSLAFDDSTVCRNYDGQRLNMLMLALSIKEEENVEQVVGRLRAEGGVVIDFVHNFATFKKHFKNRLAWYEKRCGTVKITDKPICVE